jgi:hypothetical protein
MILELPRIKGEDSFYRYYIPKVIRYELKELDSGRKENIEKHLADSLDLKLSYDEAIDQIVDSLVVILDNEKCSYLINTIEFLDNSIGINSLVSLINYGSLDIKGTHIFEYVFDYIKQNQNKILREYKRGSYIDGD